MLSVIIGWILVIILCVILRGTIPIAVRKVIRCIVSLLSVIIWFSVIFIVSSKMMKGKLVSLELPWLSLVTSLLPSFVSGGIHLVIVKSMGTVQVFDKYTCCSFIDVSAVFIGISIACYVLVANKFKRIFILTKMSQR